MSEQFLNPYNFVSIPPRPKAGTPLGDGRPPGHGRYHEDRWHGSIPVTITVRTPLLIPDHTTAALRQTDSRVTPPLDVRTDHQGRPVLAESAVKGMLRSAYEAVTNSRFGVFIGDRPLAIRANAQDALKLRPARVVACPKRPTLRWLASLRPNNPKRNVDDPQTAVWVPIRLLDEAGAEHGNTVQAWMHLFIWSDGRRTAYVWRASEVVLAGTGATLSAQGDEQSVRSRKLTPMDHPGVRVTAIVHRTHGRFPAATGTKQKKHDERLFVTDVIDKQHATAEFRDAPLAGLTAGWQRVIDSFAAAHETESDLASSYGTYVTQPQQWRVLRPGHTCYAEISAERRNGRTVDKVTALLPAMIGRRPFAGTPGGNLPREHHPAGAFDELSPADRVFGWVRQLDGQAVESQEPGVAYRGHLRIEPGDEQPDAQSIDRSFTPLRLTTLNSPKPEQFLFYLGDKKGQPLDGVAKQPNRGYRVETNGASKRLRGRKVYLTHRDVVDDTSYWTPPDQAGAPQLADGRHREYLALKGTNDKLITTISSWVKPGTTFHYTIRLDNLNPLELGALLWLLTLDDGYHHKIGLGKPLGFGAVDVRADLSRANVFTGHAMRERYRSLTPKPVPARHEELTALRQDFARHCETAKVTSEFLAAARGYQGLSLHYPRLSPEPTATSYDWWVANDRGSKNTPASRHALPLLDEHEAPALPYVPGRSTRAAQGWPSRRSTTRTPTRPDATRRQTW